MPSEMGSSGPNSGPSSTAAELSDAPRDAGRADCPDQLRRSRGEPLSFWSPQSLGCSNRRSRLLRPSRECCSSHESGSPAHGDERDQSCNMGSALLWPDDWHVGLPLLPRATLSRELGLTLASRQMANCRGDAGAPALRAKAGARLAGRLRPPSGCLPSAELWALGFAAQSDSQPATANGRRV
jgi:hypothetical protein